jgi:IS605 OrfB family transposase
MFNVGLYSINDHYSNNNEFLSYEENYHHCKENENYSLLHSDNVQQTLKMVRRSLNSFLGLLKQKKNGNYSAQVNYPHYLRKNARFPLIYPVRRSMIKNDSVVLGMSRKFKKEHGLTGKELTFRIPPQINPETITEVRVIPVHGGKAYKIEYVYEIPDETADIDREQYLSIDLGLNNFATITESVNGTATIICGKYIKSINRYYNKKMSELQAIKGKQGIKGITNQQSRITIKRNNRIDEFLNRAVFHITQTCLENKIGNIIIGEMEGIKQEINHGRKNNQNFVGIPYFLFKRKLKAKCERYGINHYEVNEAYTSRTDALAFDDIKEQPYGKKRRVKRGLYKSITGVLLNADVNGSLNIMRKVAGDIVVKQLACSCLVNRPIRVKLAYEQHSYMPSTSVEGN